MSTSPLEHNADLIPFCNLMQVLLVVSIYWNGVAVYSEINRQSTTTRPLPLF